MAYNHNVETRLQGYGRYWFLFAGSNILRLNHCGTRGGTYFSVRNISERIKGAKIAPSLNLTQTLTVTLTVILLLALTLNLNRVPDGLTLLSTCTCRLCPVHYTL